MLHIDINTTLSDFDLEVNTDFPAHGISAIFGRSGSGKTTLLRCIAGFHPCHGHICLAGKDWLNTDQRLFVAPHRRQIGYVFQDARLFSHLDVVANLRFAHSRATAKHQFELDQVIDILDLQGLLSRDIQDLSGGEGQRVALGRTLLCQPELLLLDEPLSALDQGRKTELLPYIKSVCDGLDIPALFVSHAIDEVAQLAAHTVVLEDGKVQSAGPTLEVLEHPGLQRLTGRFEAGVVLNASITSYDEDYQLAQLVVEGQALVLPMAHAPTLPSKVKLFVRARDVSVATVRPQNISIRNVLPGKLLTIKTEQTTPFAELSIAVGAQILHARVTRAAVAELNLVENCNLFALIKSVSFDPSG